MQLMIKTPLDPTSVMLLVCIGREAGSKAPPVLTMLEAKVLEKYYHGVILVLQAGAHDPVSVQKIFNILSSATCFAQYIQSGKVYFHVE